MRFGYTADLELDVDLAQLLRLRVAQKTIVPTALSSTPRPREINQPKIDGLGSWWESSLYTGPERAALAYCDALNEGDQPGFQAKHDVLAEHFSDRSIAVIAAIVINMNVWTRLKLAQGATPTFS